MQLWHRALLIMGLVSPAQAGAPQQAISAPSLLCEAAITAAEYTIRLPPRLLGAIAAVESGRMDQQAGIVRPWPWTINAEGVGQFFPTKANAIAAVGALRAKGVHSIDVGCLQVNLMYHPAAFPSLEAAFDPSTNARYAARFLTILHSESREWPRAIAAYHSRTPLLGAGYRSLVMARWENPVLTRTIIAHSAYRDFLPITSAYGAFENSAQAYGAFQRRPALQP